jgi:hypothetical protein
VSVPTVYIAKQDIHLAMAIVIDFIINPPLPGTQTNAIPYISIFKVLDDRGGSGNYWLQLPGLTNGQARRIFKDKERFYIAGHD